MINQITTGIAVVSFALLTFTKIDPIIIIGSADFGSIVCSE